jgi:surfeit locus 1 family protein
LTEQAAEGEGARPSRLKLVGFSMMMLILFFGFLALGTWQVERLGWKLALIARVDHRVNAAPVAAPGPDQWPEINARDDEYRHVQLAGRFLNGKETYVYATTEQGPGYWVITPLKRPDGTLVLVNRGFVPTDRKDPSTRPAGEIAGPTSVTGLMRMSEPGGTWLRANKPQQDRWYSRDVEAIAAKRGLSHVAPYFVDADSTPNPGGLPIGGLTRIHFRNSHLVYAITWYAMALLVAIATGYVWRSEWRDRRGESRG